MQLRTAGFGAVVPCACPHEAPQNAALLALDWTSFIIELALVAKVLYKHQLQRCSPSSALPLSCFRTCGLVNCAL